jgi:hypothetical protein
MVYARIGLSRVLLVSAKVEYCWNVSWSAIDKPKIKVV